MFTYWQHNNYKTIYRYGAATLWYLDEDANKYRISQMFKYPNPRMTQLI